MRERERENERERMRERMRERENEREKERGRERERERGRERATMCLEGRMKCVKKRERSRIISRPESSATGSSKKIAKNHN